MSFGWLGAAVVALSAACSEPAPAQPSPLAAPTAPPALGFVGSVRCGGCHAAEARTFGASHHAKSMQPATPETVLGDLTALPQVDVRYTFGAYPLQQYLVPGERGRLQVLELAWDARPAAEGGQRWFDPSPAGAQNWNAMCASCHSTGLRKGYDATRDHFATTFAEPNVGCEACHGPGSRHVAWAERPARGELAHAGFQAPLRGASAHTWRFEPGQTIARAAGARAASTADVGAEINRCLPCHARRMELTSEPRVVGRVLDAYAPSLIEAGLYHPDGQVDDENFEYGSFAQSRMFQAGVTCSNCHDPHGGKLVAPGDALCAQCHDAARFAAASHHRHPLESAGARCVNCHMPSQTYMGVHARRDHAIRIPRPDLSLQHGSPDACTQCHVEATAHWAARTLRGWGVQSAEPATLLAAALAAGRRAEPGANALLAKVAGGLDFTPIQRASAVALLRGTLEADARAALQQSLRDGDDLVRLGAARALDALAESERVAFGARLLDDRARAVRVEAARALAAAPSERLSARQREQRRAALQEWFAARQSTAERPETQADLAQVYVRLGRVADAERALRRALALDSQSLVARVNLADLQRATGRDAEAEALLRETVALRPSAAVAWHALGLMLVRHSRRVEALSALERAHRLAPTERDYTYAYALALRESGRESQAAELLRGLDARVSARPAGESTSEVLPRRHGAGPRAVVRSR